MTTRLRGVAGAGGVAVGEPFVLGGRDAPPADQGGDEASGDAAAELERLREASAAVADRLAELATQVAGDVGEDDAAILSAQAAFAADPEMLADAERRIARGATAERALDEALERFREQLAASDSELLAARADDVVDVRDQMLAALRGEEDAHELPEHPVVVLAEQLTPSQTARLPRDRILAVATETGSATSHAAILARGLGIPAVLAVSGLLDAAADAEVAAVDGAAGEVVLDPAEDERARIEQGAADAAARAERLAELREEPGRTRDGRAVELAANLASPADTEVARRYGAEGSGLVRTEFLFLDRDEAPSADEQAAAYAEILAGLPGHRVVFRTMDVGADKPLPFAPQPEEENPALGVRGIRLSLAEPELLATQLRGLLRAGARCPEGGRLAIMFPMVSVASELLAAREAVAAVAEDEGVDLADVEIGAMVEVPAAALGVERLAEAADFLSIGTNDLLQYLFAADRLNERVAGLADPFAPVLLDLVADVVAAARAAGAWVGVCGEAAGDPLTAAALVGLGVGELSMSPASLPEVKALLRARDATTLSEAARAARACPDAAAAREAFRDRIGAEDDDAA